MKAKTKNYLITIGVGLAIFIVMLLIRDVFTLKSALNVVSAISDGLFVAGAMLFGAGALVYVTKGGAFNMISYGFIKLGDMFKKDPLDTKYRTLSEYNEEMSKRKYSFTHLLVVGACYLALAVVFLLISQHLRNVALQ